MTSAWPELRVTDNALWRSYDNNLQNDKSLNERVKAIMKYAH